MTILPNFVKLACLEVAFPKIGVFGILICNLQNSQVMSKFVSEILEGGGTTPPQMLLHCQKEQMLSTVNKVSMEVGESICSALPFFYALIGSGDIVSSFYNQAMCKFWVLQILNLMLSQMCLLH